MRAGELALHLICHEVAWVCELCPLLPHPLPPEEVRKALPKVIREGELDLSLTGCHAQESGPCPLPGQQGGAGLVVGLLVSQP